MRHRNMCRHPSESLTENQTFFLEITFLMWTSFKVLIEFVTILLLFYVLLFRPTGMWDF